ncbi:MAG: DUF4390 domain-containing protein [Pseudomonadota bacterium]
MPSAQASEINAYKTQLVLTDDSYAVFADFNIELNPRLEEAIEKGVMLYFTADFELNRPRWYWLDEQVLSRNQTFRLSYHALTRQYRLSTGGLHQNFDTLGEALHILSRLRNWVVFDKTTIKNETSYSASLRLRLDLTAMPKTFQVTALANKDWDISSEWVRWSFIVSDGKMIIDEAK